MDQTSALRVSLLLAMGIVPFACSGDDDGGEEPAGNAGGAGAQADGGGTGGTEAGSGGVVGGARPGTCTSPVSDPETGLVTCAEGYVHRPQAVACGEAVDGAGGGNEGGGASEAPRAVPGQDPCSPGEEGCAEYYLGFCDTVFSGLGGAPGFCASGCVDDGDCGPGFVCLCGREESPSGGVCRAANCATDADCNDGFLCASYDAPPSGCGYAGIAGFACQTALDECMSDQDCATRENCLSAEQQTALHPQGRRCQPLAVCGRPFLVEAAPRLPAVTTNDAWRDFALAAPRVEHLTMAERVARAEHWARLGQMEHASIAAFARFGLQLLSLGAPADLIEASTAAMADETAHARLCFQLASAFAAAPLGPGPLDIAGSLPEASLLDVVELVIHEGCLGETVAALDAAESAAAASDPVVGAVYERIAADEARHAALAFRFLHWALERDGAGVARLLRRTLGALPSTVAARNIVEPCLRALLGLQAKSSGTLPLALPDVSC